MIYTDGIIFCLTNWHCVLCRLCLLFSEILDIMVAKFRRLSFRTGNAAITSALLGESFVFIINFKSFSNIDVHLQCALLIVISFALIIFELV